MVMQLDRREFRQTIVIAELGISFLIISEIMHNQQKRFNSGCVVVGRYNGDVRAVSRDVSTGTAVLE